MANDKAFKPTPQDAVQGAAPVETSAAVNPFETPSREGFAVFIKKTALAYHDGDNPYSMMDIVRPYGETIGDFMASPLYSGRFDGPNLWDGFADVYESIESEEGKLLFQQATGDVLVDIISDSKGLNNQSLEAAIDLMYFVSKINATELAELLVDITSERFLAGKIEEQKDEIVGTSISALISLPDDPKVNAALSKFIDSPDFPNFIFSLSGELLRRDPSRVAEIVEKYSERFKQVRDLGRQEGGDDWKDTKFVMKEWLRAIVEANPDPKILEKAQAIVNE
jgi:hypothetical protein